MIDFEKIKKEVDIMRFKNNRDDIEFWIRALVDAINEDKKVQDFGCVKERIAGNPYLQTVFGVQTKTKKVESIVMPTISESVSVSDSPAPIEQNEPDWLTPFKHYDVP